MPGGRLGSVLSRGRIAAYVPLMALSVGAAHHAADHAAGGAASGAVVGRKLFPIEGKRQRAYRQQQAKAAARKFVDEVAFVMNKDTRDGLRRTQRRLRDEFQARAGSIQASTRAALGGRRAGRRTCRRRRRRGTSRRSSTPRPDSSAGSAQDLRSLADGRGDRMADDLTAPDRGARRRTRGVGVEPGRSPAR